MSQVCSQCSRINPSEASYCYFDGVRLVGAGSGPINAATQNFPSQFVFPSGQGCRNFDQMALACQQNWQVAVDMLKGGLLASFFGGLGRADLALAAQEAARFPDQDRGLDQLLAKLPSQVLHAPKIKVEPTDINLGQTTIGTNRTIELHLGNQGMRLLYGSIASDSKWLTLGEGAGTAQKLFQFGTETVIPLNVQGQHLRAGTKPMEAQLLIESNGGNVTIAVRAMVPITPFKDGVLAGSSTPRQIAEKAKANPAAAAPLFEKGAVGDWFRSNGWIYPVQGPSANGLGAVQQFFEALGLAKAPKVVISAQSLSLKGAPGQPLQTTLEVTTPEKKPVYAHATCDQAWVDVSKVKLAGRLATITVNIPSVPARPGEALHSSIHVQGNGNQRFTVPMTLTVLGEASPFLDLAGGNAPAPVSSGGGGSPFEGFYAGSAPLVGAASSPAVSAPAPAAATPSAPSHAREPVAPAAPKAPGQHWPAWVHTIPLGMLFLVLLGLLIRDFLGTAPAPVLQEEEIDPQRRLAVFYDFKRDKVREGEPKVVNNNLNFGLAKVDPSGEAVRLFYGENGNSNNTLIRINDSINTFGKPNSGGEWIVKPKFKDGDCVATWGLGKVHITQNVKLVPGEPVEVAPDTFKRFRDVCLVRYTIENKDFRPHEIGMRILLDTYIGKNDGVPFTIPGMSGLMSTSKEFKGADEVPDFVMALEEPSLDDPKTVVQLNLRLSDKIEPPGRVLLTRWPGMTLKKIDTWEVPVEDIADDSSVVMYWQPRKLEPGKTLELGYSYGLGNLAASKGGQMALTVGGSFAANGELSVVALVSQAKEDEKITLRLPKEFRLASGSDTQAVPPPFKGSDGKLRPSPITWRIRASTEGAFLLRAETTSGQAQVKRVIIRKTSIF